jgi:hypothetical protein
MISDVLSDAVAEIRQYQRDFPEVYDSLKLEIAHVIEVMEELRRYLDTPPAEDLKEQ